MKIGIMTFHWGANHGAVLQAYALSKYLEQHYSAQVKIIDYYPPKLAINIKNTFRLHNIKSMPRKLGELKKENKIKNFRKKLCLTKRYCSNEELKNADKEFDILISGSDQIWNPAFLKNGEGKVTPSYFLNFGGENTKKISVSASFGCEEYPLDCQEIAKPLLNDFSAISVRENSGKEILKRMGIDAVITSDPTALLTREQCEELCQTMEDNHVVVSRMILRCQSRETEELIQSIHQACTSKKLVNIEKFSVSEWLTAIKNSKMVITNSFHCVMMCLKMHTPFAVILEDGKMSGMNDRFHTLLDAFNLNNRIVHSVEDIHYILEDIDFDEIDKLMDIYSESLRAFLDKNII